MIYILKWDPDKSKPTSSVWEYWAEHFRCIQTDWPVENNDASIAYGTYFIVKVGGEGQNGIVATGFFGSEPKTKQRIPSSKEEVYVCDLLFDNILIPNQDPIIPIDELEINIPDFDWSKNSPGGKLEEKDEIILTRLWTEFVEQNWEILNERNNGGYNFINPAILKKIKNSHLWAEEVYPGWPVHTIDTGIVDVDCENIRFHRNCKDNDFHLDVGFLSIVLKIICRDVKVIKMNIDVDEWNINDFYITDGEDSIFHLRSNGIEIWCDSIEFLGTEERGIEPILTTDYEFPF